MKIIIYIFTIIFSSVLYANQELVLKGENWLVFNGPLNGTIVEVFQALPTENGYLTIGSEGGYSQCGWANAQRDITLEDNEGNIIREDNQGYYLDGGELVKLTLHLYKLPVTSSCQISYFFETLWTPVE